MHSDFEKALAIRRANSQEPVPSVRKRRLTQSVARIAGHTDWLLGLNELAHPINAISLGLVDEPRYFPKIDY